jgi:hypothetical protein
MARPRLMISAKYIILLEVLMQIPWKDFISPYSTIKSMIHKNNLSFKVLKNANGINHAFIFLLQLIPFFSAVA